MRILFQGAGAIGIAGAALFTDRHEVAVATRGSSPRPKPAYPRRIGWLDPGPVRSARPQQLSGLDHDRCGRAADDDSRRRATDDDGSGVLVATAERPPGRELADVRDPSAAWMVSDVAGTRRVTIAGWDTVLDEARACGRADRLDGAGSVGSIGSTGGNRSIRSARRTRSVGGRARTQVRWELVVLTTRPGDLDAAVASTINELAPPFLAITSQVDGDVDRARALFPGTEVVVFGPAFLSERLAPGEAGRGGEGLDGAAATTGREVRYWAPAGAPRFLIAGSPRSHHAGYGSLGGGPSAAVRRLSRRLGPLVLPVPLPALIQAPAVFIPYVAELSIRHGRWEELKSHLRRPSAAASAAVHAATGVRVPFSAALARIILGAVERLVPLDVTEYAGRHFARHEGQTVEMLEGWAESAEGRPASGGGSARALRSLARALRTIRHGD